MKGGNFIHANNLDVSNQPAFVEQILTDEWKNELKMEMGKTQMHLQMTDGLITLCYNDPRGKLWFSVDDKIPTVHRFDAEGNLFGRTTTYTKIQQICTDESVMKVVNLFFETHPYK